MQPGPVQNLTSLLEKAGIIVYFLKDASEKFDGMTLFTNSGQPIIFINDDFTNDRKRFTIAHELGHLIMHLRFDLFEVPEKELEDQANEFAAEFLLPYLDSRADLTGLKYKDLGIIKQYWKVSKASIIVQAYKRGFIDKSRYQYMLIELSRSGERKKESVDVDLDQPKILTKIADAFTKDLGYSIDEIEKAIGISRSDFDYFIKQQNISLRLKLVI